MPCAHSISDGELVFVDTFQRDGVDLDRDASVQRGVDAAQYLVEIAPAGDGAEFFRVERVERYIDALDAMSRQFARVFFELRAVGGERQFVERAGLQMTRQRTTPAS